MSDVRVINVAHPEVTTTVVDQTCGLCGGPLPCLTHSQHAAYGPSDRARWAGCPPARKAVPDKTCHGKDVTCLPGRGGKCVACFDDD